MKSLGKASENPFCQRSFSLPSKAMREDRLGYSRQLTANSSFTSSHSSQTPSYISYPGQTAWVLLSVKQEQASTARWEINFGSGSPQNLSWVTTQTIESPPWWTSGRVLPSLSYWDCWSMFITIVKGIPLVLLNIVCHYTIPAVPLPRKPHAQMLEVVSNKVKTMQGPTCSNGQRKRTIDLRRLNVVGWEFIHVCEHPCMNDVRRVSSCWFHKKTWYEK